MPTSQTKERKSGTGFLRYESRNRETGALIRIVDFTAADSDFDYEEDAPWGVICHTHGAVIAVDTITRAGTFRATAPEWCDGCKAIVKGKAEKVRVDPSQVAELRAYVAKENARKKAEADLTPATVKAAQTRARKKAEKKAEAEKAETDKRVAAIRADKIIGRGSCSFVDECNSDADLLAALDHAGITAPSKAVAYFRRQHRSYEALHADVAATAF